MLALECGGVGVMVIVASDKAAIDEEMGGHVSEFSDGHGRLVAFAALVIGSTQGGGSSTLLKGCADKVADGASNCRHAFNQRCHYTLFLQRESLLNCFMCLFSVVGE